MRKVIGIIAATGLMSLAACNSQQAEQAETNAEMTADNLHSQADNLSAAADEATTDNAESALENAASVAAIILTTDALVTERPEKSVAGAAGGGMPDYD